MDTALLSPVAWHKLYGLELIPAHSSTVCFISLCPLSILLSSSIQLILSNLQSSGHCLPFNAINSTSYLYEIFLWLKFPLTILFVQVSEFYILLNLLEKEKKMLEIDLPVIFCVVSLFFFFFFL